MKYIIICNPDEVVGFSPLEKVITFDESLVHSIVAMPFVEQGYVIVSAGFFYMLEDWQGVRVTDGSESLGLEPREEDPTLIGMSLEGVGALQVSNLKTYAALNGVSLKQAYRDITSNR
jgi:hypothetical protein